MLYSIACYAYKNAYKNLFVQKAEWLESIFYFTI